MLSARVSEPVELSRGVEPGDLAAADRGESGARSCSQSQGQLLETGARAGRRGGKWGGRACAVRRRISGAGAAGTRGRARGLGGRESTFAAAASGVPAALRRRDGVDRDRRCAWASGGQREDTSVSGAADGTG